MKIKCKTREEIIELGDNAYEVGDAFIVPLQCFYKNNYEIVSVLDKPKYKGEEMILEEIHFKQGCDILYVKKVRISELKTIIVVVRNGIEIVNVDTELASLVGDCLRHMGCETEFLGLKSCSVIRYHSL